jgi:hypothetical protein
MKKIISLLSAVALIIGLSAQKAQAQTSVSAHATAEVIQALTATEVATLNFGRFSPENAGGEIRLSPDGSRSASGTVTLSGGLYNPASFHLTGHNDVTVTISLPTSSAMLTNSTSGKTMEVNNWETFPSVSSGAGVLTKGLLAINVGATLKVGSSNENPVGIYSGTYTITFSYN